MTLSCIGRTAFSGVSEAGISGVPVLCDARGIVYLPEDDILVVSDLHLEKGSRQARRGYMLPPYDTAATLARLGTLIGEYAPATVVSLGDSFDDRDGAERMPEPFRASLLQLMRGRDWYWVAGNHDPEKPADLPGTTVDEIAIGPLTLRHEPAAGPSFGEISGHLHPAARIVRRGMSVRRRCFATDGDRLIMPAFGTYTGALNVLDRAFGGLFDVSRLVAHMIARDAIYPMDGRYLRAG